MPTAIGIDLHFLAKKAKYRLNNNTINFDKYDGQARKIIYDKDFDNYYKVVKMLNEDTTIYDPISKLLGKDLSKIPDSPSKQRLVLETSNMYAAMRARLRKEIRLAVREHKNLKIGDLDISPDRLIPRI